MSSTTKRRKIAGDIYVVTNDCYVKVYSSWAKKKVRAVKIGRAKDFVTRIGNLSSGVFEDFTYHLVLHTTNVVRCEDDIHDLFKDYRIFTKEGGRTEFFKCPLEEVFVRINKYVSKNPELVTIKIDNGIKGKPLGRSATDQRKRLRTEAEAKARKRTKAQQVPVARKDKRGNFNFNMIGLGNGARLVFWPTGAKVTAVKPNKVKKGDEVFTLTGYAKKFMPAKMRNSKDAYQGPAYFTYKGGKLTKMREEIGA